MTSVQLEIPESQVVALVRQLSPGAKHAVLQMLVPGLSELDELDGLDDLEALADYDEAVESGMRPTSSGKLGNPGTRRLE